MNDASLQPAHLQLSGVTRRFGDVVALNAVSLAVRRGEMCVVVGPSGCGKSTLLRVIAGLEPADTGTVTVAGADVTALPPRERDVAFVFQSYALYPHLSVRDNLEFPLKVRGVDREERRRRAEETAAMLGIDGLLGRRPRQLSGGQRQRVAMGRAIVRRPSLFLFDEPLSNLDARLRARMRIELVELHQRLGTTAVYVTHDQAEAMTLGEKVVVMREGQVLQCGGPRAVFDRPADTFVASFFGSPPMNLLAGEVVRDRDGAAVFRCAAGQLPVPVPAGTVEGRLVLGIRPEHLALDETGPLAFRVAVVEDLGADRYAFGTAGDAEITVRMGAEDPTPAVSATVRLAVRSGGTHWFRDGRRLHTEESP